MKFGMEMVFEGGKVLGILPSISDPAGTGCVKGVQGASAKLFGKNFIKKLQGTLNLVGACHLFGPQIWIHKAWPQGQGITLVIRPNLTCQCNF